MIIFLLKLLLKVISFFIMILSIVGKIVDKKKFYIKYIFFYNKIISFIKMDLNIN